MQTMIVILICIALVGIEMLGVAVLVAPRAVWRAFLRLVRKLAVNLWVAFAQVREVIGQFMRFRGPGLRPPRLA